MNYLEKRYLRPSPYRRQKEARELSDLDRYLLASGMFLIFALAFFCDTVIEPRFVDRAQAAEVPTTEVEICANLERYSNGAEFADYCNDL